MKLAVGTEPLNRRVLFASFEPILPGPMRQVVTTTVLVFSLCLCSFAAFEFEHGIVASGHPLATKAGIEAMKKGGNAVDAAVATALTLGVVDGFNSGIGGGCLFLLRQTNGAFVAIDGRETAPAAATRDMFVRDGKADTSLSQAGALASATPGALAVYELVLRKHGRLSLKEHLLAAATVAEEGFVLSKRYATVLNDQKEKLAKFDSTRSIFLKQNGEPYREGEVFKQPDLAKTYRSIAQNGIAWFYAGPFADATERWMKQNKGVLTAADFRAYRPVYREPVFSNYRGTYTIASFPPPSSGGVVVAEILNILQTRDLRQMATNPVDKVHFIAEAMKLAFADRAYWLGDPDFVQVPRGLISKQYARNLATHIRMDTVTPVTDHATPPEPKTDVFKKHTTHFSTADAQGNWVACTATINTSFGSKVVVPGTGVLLNNEMDDFSIEPGVANAFGLVGAEANAVAPGKRPLSSMSPTIVLKDGQPFVSLGAAGGPTIISQTVLNLVNILDFDMDLETAFATPRFHHQWSPDQLRVEETLDAQVRAALEKRGHKLKVVSAMPASQAVMKVSGKFIGIGDPRIGGRAEGW